MAVAIRLGIVQLVPASTTVPVVNVSLPTLIEASARLLQIKIVGAVLLAVAIAAIIAVLVVFP